jgi:transcription elongation factor GreA-like protein
MAIKIAVTTPYGIDLPGAYIKINQFVGDSKYVQYSVRTYADATARTEGKQHLDEKTFSFENDASIGNVMNVCYEDLMARPEYAGAVAV